MLSIDLKIMEAFVIQRINEVEHHEACYGLSKLWSIFWKRFVSYSPSLPRVISPETAHTKDLWVTATVQFKDDIFALDYCFS